MTLEQLKSEARDIAHDIHKEEAGDAVTVYNFNDAEVTEVITTAYNTGLERAVEVVEEMDYSSEALASNETRRGYDAMRTMIIHELQAEVNKDNK